MAEPKTKEELLSEIEKGESKIYSFKEFRDSLKDLNREIDELMKPGEEGWKLLDPERFKSLFEKYEETGSRLNSYITHTANFKDEKEQALAAVCSEFRKFFASDMEVLRKYRTTMAEEQKSLPSILEDSRAETVTLFNKASDIRQGGNSERMPMKIVGRKGEDVDGFFTKACYFDPLSHFQDVLNETAKDVKDPGAAALLRNFSKIFREYHRIKGKPEDQEFENISEFFRPTIQQEGNGMPVVSRSKFLSSLAAMTNVVGARKIEELTGLNRNQLPETVDDFLDAIGKRRMALAGAKMGIVFNSMYSNRNAGITFKSRTDTRNVAMCNVAELLGVPDIICEARMMKVKDKDGNVTDGIFMAKAKGVDSNHPPAEYRKINRNAMLQGDRLCLKQLADLQVLDYICGNPDRHGGNFFFIFDAKGKAIGIQGIDNDLSFGKLGTESQEHMMAPEEMGVISRQMADRVMSLDEAQLEYALYGVLGKDEVKAACSRLATMKNAIQMSRNTVNREKQKANSTLDRNGIDVPYGYLRELGDEDWRNVKTDQLITRTHAKNIFNEAAETLDDYGVLANKANKGAKYETAVNINRATATGITSRLKKTRELKSLLSERSSAGRSSDNYRDVQDALAQHEKLLAKIIQRMKDCKKKAGAGMAEPDEFFKQYVTKDDLRKMIASEKKIQDTAAKYTREKKAKIKLSRKAVKDYTKLRIEAIADVSEFVKDGQSINPEEERALAAGHRKAVEQIVREIRKNPNGPAAGPKSPVVKKKPAGKTGPDKNIKI